MRRLPSASSLDRAFACPPSQAYRHLRAASDTIWSRRGKVIHRFLVRVAEVGRDKALEEVPSELYEACECIEVEKLPAVEPSAYAYEVAFALDLEAMTARELGRNLEREEAYALAKDDELVGTADVIGLLDDAVVVGDYKTGYRWFDKLEENAQLMFYALCACLAYGKRKALLAVIRINEEGHPYFIWAEVDWDQLQAFAARLRALDEQIAFLSLLLEGGEELEPVTGDHCDYCPAVHCCPAWMKLARNMTSPEDDTGGLPALTEETAPLYVEALKRGGKVLERIEKALKLYAAQAPIDLEGGWVYGPHPFPNREWDIAKALPVLKGYLGDEAALGTVRAEVVEKQIYEAFRERKKAEPKLAMGKETDRVIEALKAQGGLRIRYSLPVGRHKPKPEDAEILKQLTGGDTNAEGSTEEAGERDGDAPGQVA